MLRCALCREMMNFGKSVKKIRRLQTALNDDEVKLMYEKDEVSSESDLCLIGIQP